MIDFQLYYTTYSIFFKTFVFVQNEWRLRMGVKEKQGALKDYCVCVCV